MTVVPKILCGRCMVAADVVFVTPDPGPTARGFYLLKCHDIEELIPEFELSSMGSGSILVWENLVGKMMEPSTLQAQEKSALAAIFAATSRVELFHRVRCSQGEPPTIANTAEIDRVIDTLLLFREERRK